MNSHLHSSLEPLEDRIAPAGIVTVTIVAGNVTLTGDAADNLVEIDPGDPTQLHLIATSGTQFHFGTNPLTASMFVPGFSGDLKVALGVGVDTITLDKGTLPGNVILDGGSSDPNNYPGDTIKSGPPINAGNLGDHIIAGNLTLKGSTGFDDINLTANQFLVGGDVNIPLGSGANTVALNAVALTVMGDFHYTTTGNSENSTLNVTGAKFIIGGDTTATVSQADSYVTFNASDTAFFGGKVTITGGAVGIGHVFTVHADNDLAIKGAVTMTCPNLGLDSFDLSSNGNLAVGGKVMIAGGPGGDTVTISAANARFMSDLIATSSGGLAFTLTATSNLLVAGKLTVTGSSQADAISVTAPGTVVGLATFALGAGTADTFALKGTAASDLILLSNVKLTATGATGTTTSTFSDLTIFGSLMLTTGAAADKVSFDNLTLFGATTVSLGAGVDQFNFETGGLAGTSTVGAAMNILLGLGNDKAFIGNNSANDRVIFNVASILNAGAGAGDITATMAYGNVFNQPLTVLFSETAT